MTTLLLRFVASASLARLTNAGLALALVLLAEQRTGSTAQAGVLVAAATFPQLVTGPLLGPVLDRSRRPWALLRIAGVVTTGAAILLATTLGRAPLVVPVLGALAMSCVEPVLNGGVSAIAGRGSWAMRVFAWDSLAYNVAGLAGPAVVTAVAVLASPAWALVALGLGAGAITLTSLGLTVADDPDRSRHGPGRRTIAAAVHLMASNAALRSATLATTLAMAALGGRSFALVAATEAVGRRPADAGIALTVSATGGLVGSLAMTRRRSPARPERTVLAAVAALGVVLVVMAAGSWPIVLAGAFVLGVIDGPLLVGLFATRSEHSPPALRATVFTVGASAKLGLASVGALLAGVVLDGRATAAGLVAIGAAHLAAAGLGWLSLRSGPAPAPGTSPSRRSPAARR